MAALLKWTFRSNEFGDSEAALGYGGFARTALVELNQTARKRWSVLSVDLAVSIQMPWVEILQSIRSSSTAAKTSATGGQYVLLPSSTRTMYRS